MDDCNDIESHPRVADLCKPPPRDFTPELKKAVRLIGDATSSYSRIWITILGQYIGMGFFAVLFFILPEVDIFVSIGFLAWAVLFHAGALFFKHRYFGKIRRLVINGSVKTILVLDNWINWSTQVNNTPQRRISFELDGVESNCKTYSHRMADEFSGTIPVLIHPRLKFVIPLGFLIHYAIEEKKP